MTYPDLYGKFVEHISFLDLDLTWMLSANCFINTNFYHHLLTITIGPLVVCGLVLASYRRSSDDPRLRCDVKRRHATVVYIISVLVYSSASSAVFQTFACDDLDNGKSFLRADHSIQCDTTAHKLYKAYAGVMCLLYPLGIPFCYAAILYPVRECLKSDNKQVREKATVLRALAAPYRKEVYYYEVVECLRRVTLSGLVVFILPNTAGQVITTFLLSLFFFAVFMGLDPHELGFDKWLDRIGHAIVMMSMFVALAVKVDIERDDEFSQEVFAGALVVANCVMVLTILVESCMVCLSDDVSMGLVNFTPAGNFIREAWGPVRRAGR